MTGSGPSRSRDASAYLDHAASTPMRPEAVEAMVPFLTEHHGNPSGSHAAARHARRAIDDARDQVATLLGCRPGEVVFTSGGTESDVAAIRGSVAARPGPVLTTGVEHAAVLSTVEALTDQDTSTALVPVDGLGRIDLDALTEALAAQPDTTLVSVGLANNETGTVQDLAAVAAAMAEVAPEATLHTDAVQAAAWLDLAALAAPARLIAASAHKLGGPKGVGALTVRQGTPWAPLITGGGQERGLRSGTHNVAGIVAFGVAARIAVEERAERFARVQALRDRLARAVVPRLRTLLPGLVETATDAGDRTHLLPGHLHLCLPGCPADEVLFLLDTAGVAATAASSCASGATSPSHVLAALGIDDATARGSIRLTVGWSTTEDEIDHAASALLDAVARIRGVAA